LTDLGAKSGTQKSPIHSGSGTLASPEMLHRLRGEPRRTRTYNQLIKSLGRTHPRRSILVQNAHSFRVFSRTVCPSPTQSTPIVVKIVVKILVTDRPSEEVIPIETAPTSADVEVPRRRYRWAVRRPACDSPG
jgi:hypothetical protein